MKKLTRREAALVVNAKRQAIKEYEGKMAFVVLAQSPLPPTKGGGPKLIHIPISQIRRLNRMMGLEDKPNELTVSLLDLWPL